VGSLWLTAFVLKTFSQAKELTFIDETVLSERPPGSSTSSRPDGSFESVGFVHHQDMMGGVQGKDTLTAYVAVALLEAGENAAAAKALDFLEGRVDAIDDPYALALVAYALELGDSDRAGDAMQKLVAAAIEDDNGLHWSSSGGAMEPGGPQPFMEEGGRIRRPAPSLDIEATAYATLALIAADDRVSAAQAARWLVGQRNSQGGSAQRRTRWWPFSALIQSRPRQLRYDMTWCRCGVNHQGDSRSPLTTTMSPSWSRSRPAWMSSRGQRARAKPSSREVLRYNLLEPEEAEASLTSVSSMTLLTWRSMIW